MAALGAEENASRFAAHANAARSKSDSEEWFAHRPLMASNPSYFRLRIRPEAVEITAKNRRPAGSLGRMAGFVNDPDSPRTASFGRKLRSEEAHEILQRMTRPTDDWCDFEGNCAAISAVQRAPRLGASLEAKMIMESQMHKCDWFTHGAEPVAIRPKSIRPSAVQAGTLSCDWFAHSAADQSEVEGCKDLLKTAPPENPSVPLHRCPTKESLYYCRQNKGSKSVLECLRICTLSKEPKYDVSSSKMKSEDTSAWSTNGTSRNYGNAFLQNIDKAGLRGEIREEV
ncbi:hypothetical protein EGR_01490 [Echinococcus granulosus]|uniref:Uncharacterized protein n=1 Tax=Echinococcus granulosus TaxID=6210 RepID=W6UYV5_ECHGR|nr:hypothetical protein EGR_01490 [Echinococcus granulosus]EUB63867.1 hypothetical protein EGR_01490 [Echinococcus granulosus]